MTQKVPAADVAVLGPRGTFSDLAVDALKKVIGASGQDLHNVDFHGINEKIYCKTIHEVIEKVASGEVQFGLVPFENNLYGTVRETEDTLFQYTPRIQLALEMPIHHALITLDGKGEKGEVSLHEIEKIFSHQQGIEQCDEFIQKNCPQAQTIIVNSTGFAVSELEKETRKCAAIASSRMVSEVAAKSTDGKSSKLHVLAENIENHPENMTTFFLITQADKKTSVSQKATAVQQVARPGNSRTLIAFWFDKNQPGTLHEVLGVFAAKNINLTKIESRPYPSHPGEYIFFLEFEEKDSSKITHEVLQKIQNITSGTKNFGSYRILRSAK